MKDDRMEYERNLKETLSVSNIIDICVEDELKKSFISYAMAVNVSRAIPDVRDGLKPVHRRILYAMNELGLSNDKPYRKCARIVGDVLGKYHPHGDTAVYDALVRLAQDFSIRCPLVQGHGNFGSIDGDPPAAQRYTEARLSKISGEMLRDIDKKTVDYYPNFDDTLEQPVVLPSRYPNLLVNGSDGIAVGMATSIPPHNLGEVIDGTIALINNGEITIDELMEFIPAPDYPTGGLVLGRAAIKQAYRTGRGGALIRARAEIMEVYGRQCIVITELPYQVNKAKLIENIADQVKEKRLVGISDIREESDREGMRVVIEIKRDANPQIVLNTLYKQTNMQVKHGMIMLALVRGTPRVLNIKQMLEEYILHQVDVVTRRTKFELERAEERAHILRGLAIAQANIDEVIALIKQSSSKDEAQRRLKERFLLSDKQVNAILEMKLQRLTNLEVHKIAEELLEKEKLIIEYTAILQDENKVREIIIEELLEIKDKYSTPRMSELTYDYGEIDIEDLIEKEDIVISMTHSGYIKRQAVSEYKSQRRGGVGITAHKPKQEDFVENLFVANTHTSLLFFTNKGKVYRIKGYEVPEAQRTARGRALVNLLPIEQDEKVTELMPVDYSAGGYLTLATKNGLIKKTALTEFESIRKDGKIAISLLDGDELIGAKITNEEEHIIIATKKGKCIRFGCTDVRAMGRTAQGVRSIRLGEGDEVVDITIIGEGSEILTISANGYGKRSNPSDYRLQTRGGKGIKAGIFNDATGDLIDLKAINAEDDAMLITDNGTIIRVRVDEISKISRNTKGVRIMRLKKDGQIVKVAITAREEETEENNEEENIEAIVGEVIVVEQSIDNTQE